MGKPRCGRRLRPVAYGYSAKRKSWGANASLNSIFSGTSYNEARIGYLYVSQELAQNSSAVGQHFPYYYIGQNYLMPQGGTDRKLQILDDFSTILNWHGEHQVKVGASWVHWKDASHFALASGGVIYYGSDDESQPYKYQVGYGDPTAPHEGGFLRRFSSRTSGRWER